MKKAKKKKIWRLERGNRSPEIGEYNFLMLSFANEALEMEDREICVPYICSKMRDGWKTKNTHTHRGCCADTLNFYGLDYRIFCVGSLLRHISTHAI